MPMDSSATLTKGDGSEEAKGPSGKVVPITIASRSKLLDVSSDFIAGLFGGCAGLVFGHPFDTIKVLQQTAKAERTTIMACLKNTIKHEGPLGFFKGMAYPLASVGFLNSIALGVYGNAKKTINNYRYGDPNAKSSYSDIFIAGAIGGGVWGFPATPFELVKVKLQAQTAKSTYKGPWDCIKVLYRTNGLQGCFQGMGSTITREIPGFATYMTTYAFLCDQMTNQDEGETPFSIALIAGGAAGVTSWTVTFPLDIIKSRLQADSPSNPHYKGFFDCVKKLYKQKGIRVFWHGLPVTLLRSFPLNAVTLGVYSEVLKFL